MNKYVVKDSNKKLSYLGEEWRLSWISPFSAWINVRNLVDGKNKQRQEFQLYAKTDKCTEYSQLNPSTHKRFAFESECSFSGRLQDPKAYRPLQNQTTQGCWFSPSFQTNSQHSCVPRQIVHADDLAKRYRQSTSDLQRIE